MYFKKLEIFGFKSFADRTVLKFEPGITAVVGPNGCGKSNVFDSIRWVLGEQKVKELRGSSMEDVIFNGTQHKPSLGFAEVSVTFDNKERKLNYDADEVVITRKLFRSGESEYLLNKTICRLKDIQELLMGTGIGAESYSLVQQGRVDSIVSARPDERRSILDEAAGITKYKVKKKEAMLKLKATEDNLLRLNDIVIEVKRQIASIERQASKARRYKEKFDRLKELELSMAHYDLNVFLQKKEEIQKTFQEHEHRESALVKRLDAVGEFLTTQINALDEIEEQSNDLKSEEIRLSGQIDLNKRQVDFNVERVENLTMTEQRLNEQKEKLFERCRNQQQMLEELKNVLITTEHLLKQNQSVLEDKKIVLFGLEQSINGAKNTISTQEEKILQLTTKQVHCRNRMTEVMKEQQGALARKKRLDMEMEKVALEKNQTDVHFLESHQKINHMKMIVDNLILQRDEKQRDLVAKEGQMVTLEVSIDSLEKKKLFLISQKEFIEKLHTQYQETPDAVIEGTFVTTSAPQAHQTGIIGKVKGVKLVENLSVGLPMNNETAQQLYQIICETKFIELDPIQISNKIDEVSQQMSELMFEREALKSAIDKDRFEIKSLFAKVYQQEKELSILESQKKEIQQDQFKLFDEIDLIRIELDEVARHLDDVRKKEEQSNFELETVNQEMTWCQNDIKEQRGWIAQKSNQKEDALVEMAQLEGEISSNKERLLTQQANQSMFIETLDSWLEEIKRIDDQVSGQGMKREELETEIVKVQEKIREIESQKEDLQKNLAVYVMKQEDMGVQINALREDMKGEEEELDAIKQTKHFLLLEEQKLGFNQQSIKDRLVQTYKIDYDLLMENQEELTQVLFKEGDLNPYEGLTYRDAGNCLMLSYVGPDLKMISMGLPQLSEGMSLETVREEISNLRRQCESFGVVNLVAIEEYEELKERFMFLTKQQSDLLEAQSQLLETIKKINRSTRQMFLDSFTKVSEQFRIYFRMLFGGGEAELILLDPENVLESGVDIVARPPGKKLQNISLLSGGERTLAAIALVFGVFKVNPSPFCVLDEIDAALDEANVDRYANLLKEFSKLAQFIVITHNKSTMERADILYGITMPETGVSRVVSVCFKEQSDGTASNVENKQEEELVVVG